MNDRRKLAEDLIAGLERDAALAMAAADKAWGLHVDAEAALKRALDSYSSLCDRRDGIARALATARDVLAHLPDE